MSVADDAEQAVTYASGGISERVGGIRVTFRQAENIAPTYTSDPRTIWALPEKQRFAAFADIFRKASALYSDAVRHGNLKGAQDACFQGISVISGLFPDREDDAHKLLTALTGALVAARSGSNRHILLQPGLRIPGTKGGLGAACIAAGAVAAVNTLEARGMTKRAARLRVAAMLKKQQYSRKRGDHGTAVPVTQSAIRAWEERRIANPIVVALVPEYRKNIEERIAAQELETAEQVAELLENITAEFLQNHIAL